MLWESFPLSETTYHRYPRGVDRPAPPRGPQTPATRTLLPVAISQLSGSGNLLGELGISNVTNPIVGTFNITFDFPVTDDHIAQVTLEDGPGMVVAVRSGTALDVAVRSAGGTPVEWGFFVTVWEPPW